MPRQTIFKDKVTIGTWTFNDPLMLPAGITQLGCNILDGWDDTSPFDALFSSRGSRDGDVPSDHFPLRSREIVLGGWMYATGRATARAAFTALCTGAFPANTDLTLARYEPDATKIATVRRTGPIEVPVETNQTGPHFRFMVTLRAFDPLKYNANADINATTGIAGVSSGGVVVPALVPVVFQSVPGQANQIVATNVGSYDTRPVTTIAGPLPSGWHWDNTTTGETLALDVDLATGDVLVLDHATETVALNDTIIAPAITGDWWPVTPAAIGGSNILKLYGDFAVGASVTVVGRSAWE